MSEYLAQPKDGRAPAHSVMLVGTVVTDPSREEEFHTWYNGMHFADVLRTEGYIAASRFRRIDPDPSPDEPKFLAIYELSTRDPMGPPTAMRPNMEIMRERGRRLEGFELKFRANLRRVR